jgi:hypothetical protein
LSIDKVAAIVVVTDDVVVLSDWIVEFRGVVLIPELVVSQVFRFHFSNICSTMGLSVYHVTKTDRPQKWHWLLDIPVNFIKQA